MLDFACKEIELEAVVRCALGLSKAEYRILSTVLRRKESTAGSLAAMMRLDRTTVQKGLTRLVEKRLVGGKRQARGRLLESVRKERR
jgi:predicted transcriptional regulator